MITNHPAILAIDSKKTGRLRRLQTYLFVQKLATTKSSHPNPRSVSGEREILSTEVHHKVVLSPQLTGLPPYWLMEHGNKVTEACLAASALGFGIARTT